MPCTDGGPSEAQLIQGRLDVVTRLLCDQCRAHPPEGGTELAVWWAEHQRQDKLRLEREETRRREVEESTRRFLNRGAARAAALEKLTDEEKEALGVRK